MVFLTLIFPLQIVWLRKKMNYLFKVLIGNVNGHYILDLSDHKARLAGRIQSVIVVHVANFVWIILLLLGLQLGD